MNILKRIFHRHDWVYNSPILFDYEIRLYQVPPRRFCKVCGLFQQKDEHVLGLNPPEYVVTWMNLSSKPRFTYKAGAWRLK